MAGLASEYFRKGLEITRRLPARDRRTVVSRLVRALKDSSDKADLFRQVVRALPAGSKPQVFISHSHKDKPFVRSLARKLTSHGVVVWLDEVELKVGESLAERISLVINKTPLLLAILSRKSVRSNWVKEELRQAMSRQIKNRRIKVLPIMKELCSVPEFLEGRVYADFSTEYRRRRNFPLLLQSIAVHSQKKMMPR